MVGSSLACMKALNIGLERSSSLKRVNSSSSSNVSTLNDSPDCEESLLAKVGTEKKFHNWFVKYSDVTFFKLQKKVFSLALEWKKECLYSHTNGNFYTGLKSNFLMYQISYRKKSQPFLNWSRLSKCA